MGADRSPVRRVLTALMVAKLNRTSTTARKKKNLHLVRR
jgi:hypothetical protein